MKAIPEIFRTTYVVDNQKASYEYRPVVKAVFALEVQFFNDHRSGGFQTYAWSQSIALEQA